MKRSTILLLPILALSLSSCVVEVPSTGTPSTANSTGYTPNAPVANSDSPNVRTLPNGDIQVVYPGQGRDVVFDSNGTLKAGGYGCNDEDLFRAKQAVRNYLGR